MGHIDLSNLNPVFQQALAPFVRSPSTIARHEPINMITLAIRDAGRVDCDDIRKILNELRKQMDLSGFSKLDLDRITEAADFITGQDYGDALDSMHDEVNAMGKTSRIETANLIGNAERSAK